jgi:hypothetical protein
MKTPSQGPKTCTNCGTEYFEGETCACGNPTPLEPQPQVEIASKGTDPKLWWLLAVGIIALILAVLAASPEVQDTLGAVAAWSAMAFGAIVAVVFAVGLLVLFSGLLLKGLWLITYTLGNGWHSGRLAAEEGERSAKRSG